MILVPIDLSSSLVISSSESFDCAPAIFHWPPLALTASTNALLSLMGLSPFTQIMNSSNTMAAMGVRSRWVNATLAASGSTYMLWVPNTSLWGSPSALLP